MNFSLKEVLETVGPTAALVFASWLFLQYLEARYLGAYDRYRDLTERYRSGRKDLSPERRDSLRGQIILYKRRCEQMKLATNIGLFGALCLLSALACGVVDVMVKGISFIQYVGSFAALAGLLLVIFASFFVLRENSAIQKAIDSELMDLPEIASQVENKSGGVKDELSA